MYKIKVWDGTKLLASDIDQAREKAIHALQGWRDKEEGDWIGSYVPDHDPELRVFSVFDMYHEETDAYAFVTKIPPTF